MIPELLNNIPTKSDRGHSGANFRHREYKLVRLGLLRGGPCRAKNRRGRLNKGRVIACGRFQANDPGHRRRTLFLRIHDRGVSGEMRQVSMSRCGGGR